MKFMKLGSRPDAFHTAEDMRSVCSEVSSDLIVQVKGKRYLLHKFPLLSKCLRLQKLCTESPESSSSSSPSQHQTIQLPDFPGGTESFELCAKFCYGMTIHISSYNIVSARCAAEYLQMTEDVEKGNLIHKLEVFFNSCILRGWKDSIVTLQTTKSFGFLSEDLKITSRCIESIASKVLKNPSKNQFSRSLSKKGTKDDNISCNGTRKGHWWAEDIAELGLDLYWRIMIVIKSGKIPSDLIGDALNIYASRWLLNISQDVDHDDSKQEKNSKDRLLLESIVCLLPAEKGSVSCRFLCKLLKAANILNASSSPKIELARRIGIQLEEAKINDLLIPSQTSYKNDTIHDVDIVIAILEQFMLQWQSPPTSPLKVRGGGDGFERRRSRSAENIDFEFQESRRSSSASHSSKLKVAKLVDGYLQEIASDVNLPLSKMISISEVIPDFARLDHDTLYRAIDIYLKAHPDLNKSERKRLCQVLDCKKLSMEGCIHAAQNELLPLRVVVQVLFFEQARAALAGGQLNDLPKNIQSLLTAHTIDPSPQPSAISTTTSIQAEDQWSVSGLKSPKLKPTSQIKLDEDDNDLDEHDLHDRDGIGRSSRFKSFCAIPTRPKRMLSKLLSINRNGSEKT